MPATLNLIMTNGSINSSVRWKLVKWSLTIVTKILATHMSPKLTIVLHLPQLHIIPASITRVRCNILAL